MSALNHLFDLPEQICYVQCGSCNTILLVSVPCSSLSKVVTVRCGHCTTLLSVNMTKASFLPLHLLASLHHQHHQDQTKEEEEAAAGEEEENLLLKKSSPDDDNEEEEDTISLNHHHIVNKPPEKRQRAPSAYNRFIKEEIRRLKAENPNMAHKEAFSTAAKNWANFPPIQYKGDEESCVQQHEKAMSNSDSTHEVNGEGNCFRERKAPRHSIWTKTPFE